MLDAVAEADAEGYPDTLPGEELSDAEFEQMMAAAEAGADYSDAVESFDAAFAERAAAEQAREQARLEFAEMDLIRLARRMEDKVARAFAKAEAGLYDGQQADFAAEAAAVEIMLSNGGSGPCGVTDSYGLCAEHYHQLGCSHDVSVDWAASPNPATGVNALSNFADRMDLNLARRSVWGDVDDPDMPDHEVPAHTVELAHELATDWNLGDPGYADALRPPSMPRTPYQALYDEVSFDDPAPQPMAGGPGIRELAERMGLR